MEHIGNIIGRVMGSLTPKTIDNFPHMVPVIVGFGGEIRLRGHKEGYCCEVKSGNSNIYYVATDKEPELACLMAVEAAYKDIVRRESV